MIYFCIIFIIPYSYQNMTDSRKKFNEECKMEDERFTNELHALDTNYLPIFEELNEIAHKIERAHALYFRTWTEETEIKYYSLCKARLPLLKEQNKYHQKERELISINTNNLNAIADKYHIPRSETSKWIHHDSLSSY